MDTRGLVTSLLKPVATDLKGKKGFFSQEMLLWSY